MFVQPNLLTDISKLSDETLKELDLDFSKISFFTGGTVFSANNTRELLAKTKAKYLIQVSFSNRFLNDQLSSRIFQDWKLSHLSLIHI